MSHDRNYHYSRAEAELRVAQKATSVEAVRAHSALAGLHLDRAYGGNGERPSSAAIRSVLDQSR